MSAFDHEYPVTDNRLYEYAERNNARQYRETVRRNVVREPEARGNVQIDSEVLQALIRAVTATGPQQNNTVPDIPNFNGFPHENLDCYLETCAERLGDRPISNGKTLSPRNSRGMLRSVTRTRRTTSAPSTSSDEASSEGLRTPRS